VVFRILNTGEILGLRQTQLLQGTGMETEEVNQRFNTYTMEGESSKVVDSKSGTLM
jgi:hypothetical protein